MKYFIIISLLFSTCFLKAQYTKPKGGVVDSSAILIRTSGYQALWKNNFQNSLFENNLSGSAKLQMCVPEHLHGMFCKMEYKIETKSKLAPRFRLGSLNYTNWMEGKGAYYTRYSY